MLIQFATTPSQLAVCWPIMQQLRPQLSESLFISQVQRQMQAGYQLAYIEDRGVVVAVTGFRISENLAWGRFLYIDDLVTQASVRSQGYGNGLLDELKQIALDEGCQQLHLDSGVQRKEAHRFYEREGLSATSLHFCVLLGGGE